MRARALGRWTWDYPLPCLCGGGGGGSCGEQLTAARVVQDVASGLAHLHARFICHRDLKIENLLYVSPAEDAHVKIADFGLAQHCGGPYAPIRDPAPASTPAPTPTSAPTPALTRRCVGAARTRSHPAKMTDFAGTNNYLAPELVSAHPAALPGVRQSRGPRRRRTRPTPHPPPQYEREQRCATLSAWP